MKYANITIRLNDTPPVKHYNTLKRHTTIETLQYA